ncbi:hypothetical protein RUM43_012945 [Polyplax serrata]|uniref:Vacuolar fusion protein MON1 homolog n=1 Tax=Polyplax serrata TaxID=468196 RepID=A0AAN8NR96_POLSC
MTLTEESSTDLKTMALNTDSLERHGSAEDQDWKTAKKNFFILSTAGKPIYSLYGSEDKLVTTFGVMQALVSFVQSNDDSIRAISAGNTKFVFLIKEPIILVTVSKTRESESQLTKQLHYLYNLILSILTSTQLKKIYEERRNFDFRRLLSGSERLIDHMLNFMNHELGFALESVRCLNLEPSIRNGIRSNIVSFCGKIKKLVFALLIGNNRLIASVRMEKYTLHPVDMHIIFNLIDSTESFKQAESWTPICLPMFNPSGFLHAHVSYLADDCQACLVLLTVDKDIFFQLSEAKQKLVEKLRRNGHLEAINESLTQPTVGVSAIEAPEVRHLLYKNRQTSQYWCPSFEAPYITPEEVERIYSLYKKMYENLHTKNLKLVLEQFGTETIFAWINADLEFYVVFEPLATKETIANSASKIVNWIKKEQGRLFMLNDSTF